MVADDKKVTISNLSGIFQVAEGTIRRDLKKLEDEGFLTRAYGGTILNTAMLTGNTHSYKHASSFYEGKQLIVRKALLFVDNKTTMTADSNSTVMKLLKLLRDRSGLALLTNSAEAIHVLAQSGIKAVSTGGKLSKNILSLQGRITKEIIRRYHVDIMVISCKGLDINSGALDPSEAEAEVKRTTIRQATGVVLLIDHSKFDRKAFVQLADFSHINHIMTDKSPGAEWIASRRDNNIQLVW